MQVFAYGQTGSGKTYTMGTAASVKEVSGKAEALGVIPHSIKFIFAAMQQSRADYDLTMKVTFFAVAACSLTVSPFRAAGANTVSTIMLGRGADLF